MIIVLACFAIAGLAAGFVLRLPAFAILWFLAVVGYAVFGDRVGDVLRLTYHVLFVGIALQIGYFLAIVIQTLRPSGANNVLHPNRKDARGDSDQER